MEKIIKRFGGLMLISLIMPLLDLIVGVIFLAYPEFLPKVSVIIIGSLVLVHGLFFLIRYFYDGIGTRFFAIDLILGIAAIILGIFTIYNPYSDYSSKVIGIFYALWLFLSGIEKIYYSYQFRKEQEEIYPLILFIGVMFLLMGIISLFRPFRNFIFIVKLIGIFLICSGLFEAMSCNLFRQRASKILPIIK